MRNCVAYIYQDSGQLESGQRRRDAGGELLYRGPAFLRTPSNRTEHEAAPELRAEAELHLKTRVNMKRAERVEISNHVLAGTYFVESGNANHSGRAWVLELGRG